MTTPRLLVLSSLFPNAKQPAAGVFIRERMFRVARHLPIVVVAPQAWFPLQGLIRLVRPHSRPIAAMHETMDGIEIHRPRFLSFPGVLKWADGFFMAVSIYFIVRRLMKDRALNVLDVHFGYPDGYAGHLLARWLDVPLVLTLRGKEQRQARSGLRRQLTRAVSGANLVVTVSDALRDLAVALGANPASVQVIGNGIDLLKFSAIARDEARRALGLPLDARMLVTVGTLVERKGFHRVIEVLPALLEQYPNLHYLVVGGAGPEGNDSAAIHREVALRGLQDRVHFLGACNAEDLHVPLSAADLFVLASSYEGWANVLLEAMACGLPVVATDVGGNAQVVNASSLGRIVPFGDAAALEAAIAEALSTSWDRAAIRAYAESNGWERRTPILVEAFARVLDESGFTEPPAALESKRTHAR